MKSVFEEASSIAKAIEKGWEKAGHPYKFSVTIFEKPEKNFFGITKKLAKIGIFFDDQIDPKRKSIGREGQHRQYRPRRPTSRPGYQQRTGQEHQGVSRQEQGQQKQTTSEQQKKDSA